MAPLGNLQLSIVLFADVPIIRCPMPRWIRQLRNSCPPDILNVSPRRCHPPWHRRSLSRHTTLRSGGRPIAPCHRHWLSPFLDRKFAIHRASCILYLISSGADSSASHAAPEI